MQRTKLYFIILCIILQCIVVGTIICRYEYTVQTGTSLIVKTRLYDPRDIFRGDYVHVSYDAQLEEYAGNNFDTPLCSGTTFTYNSIENTIYIIPELSGDYFVGIKNIYKQKPKDTLFIQALLENCERRRRNATGEIKSDREFNTETPFRETAEEDIVEESTGYEERLITEATRQGYKSEYIARIRYIQDRFFVQETMGGTIEAAIRTGDVYPTRKVGTNGETVLINLLMNGNKIE